jgi:hypothetical protein
VEGKEEIRVSDGKKAQADIAREYMIERARQRARGGWVCPRCGVTNGPAEEFCTQCGADGSGVNRAMAPEPVKRFPSSPETRRAILEDVAKGNQKYARPFEKGSVARVSFVGTESWSDYGAVVLQMAMLDSLLSIEEKLGELLTRLGTSPGEDNSRTSGLVR